MTCSVCQEREATIHFTEIINNQITKLELCESCARRRGIELPSKPFALPFGDLALELSGIIGAPSEHERVPGKCDTCGCTWEQFRETGRFGCSDCYTAFDKPITPLVKRLHGATSHVGLGVEAQGSPGRAAAAPNAEGSRPSRAPVRFTELQKQLDQAIANEEFERAAELRDQIRRQQERR